MPKILVVDDESDLEGLINAKFRKAIKNEEMKFYFALNGAEALQILQNDPDLNIIMTDIRMPVMDGLTLLANLPKLNRPYKAIVVSAYGELSSIRVAMNRGASDFITKPIDFEDFELTLKKIIEEYSVLTLALLAESKLKELQVELDIARNIQEGMLPSNFHLFPNLDMAGKMVPAKIVGGDFFDFFPISDQHLAIVISDVSGKSISACLYMAVTKSLFRAFSNSHTSCKEVISRINNFLREDNTSCFFVTAFYAILDVKTGKLSYCNAGHNPPYIVRKNGSITRLEDKGGPALGLDAKLWNVFEPYQESSCTLEKEDCLFLYTDGVTEALNHAHEMFSEPRLQEILKESDSKTASNLIEKTNEAIKSFAGITLQHDDITMLAIRYT